MEPQLKRLYDQGLRLFQTRPVSVNAYVRAGQQTRLVLPDGSQANFVAQTDINGGSVEVAITEQGDGMAWCLSASAVANQRLTDLRRERPTVDALVPTEVRRVAMVLDNNWVYGSSQFSPVAIAENVEFLRILLQGAETVFSPPVDSRTFVSADGTRVSSPLVSVGAAMAAAVGVNVVEASLNASVDGFLWLPLLNAASRFTSAELDAIRRCGNAHGSLLVGEWTAWGGGPNSFNGHLIGLFDQSVSTTATANLGNAANWNTSAGVVRCDATGFWEPSVIDENNILGTLTGAGDYPQGAVGAAWLTGSE